MIDRPRVLDGHGGGRGRVVVDRNRPDLYAHLRRRLGPSASVLLDRRTRDAAPSLRHERRQPMTPAEAAVWDVFGYRLWGPPTDPSGELRAEVDRLARQLYFLGHVAAQFLEEDAENAAARTGGGVSTPQGGP